MTNLHNHTSSNLPNVSFFGAKGGMIPIGFNTLRMRLNHIRFRASLVAFLTRFNPLFWEGACVVVLWIRAKVGKVSGSLSRMACGFLLLHAKLYLVYLTLE